MVRALVHVVFAGCQYDGLSVAGLRGIEALWCSWIWLWMGVVSSEAMRRGALAAEEAKPLCLTCFPSEFKRPIFPSRDSNPVPVSESGLGLCRIHWRTAPTAARRDMVHSGDRRTATSTTRVNDHHATSAIRSHQILRRLAPGSTADDPQRHDSATERIPSRYNSLSTETAPTLPYSIALNTAKRQRERRGLTSSHPGDDGDPLAPDITSSVVAGETAQ